MSRLLLALPLAATVCFGFAASPTTVPAAEPVRAYSLSEANRRVEAGRLDERDLFTLGGLNRFAGMVFDHEHGDVILVGRHRAGVPEASLDDLVVALRSVLVIKQYPLVSIDPDDHTASTGRQTVRFGGGIENTRFGRDFVDSDILLKRYSLGLLIELPDLESYRTLYEQNLSEKMAKDGLPVASVAWCEDDQARKTVQAHLGQPAVKDEMVQSRFWFYNIEEKSFVTELDDVFVINELALGVKSVTLQVADKPGEPRKDELGERFAGLFSERYAEATAAYPVIGRLKTLFDMLAIATGIDHLGETRPKFDGLLARYRPAAVPTEKTYPLHSMLGEFKVTGNRGARLAMLSGGVALRPLLRKLQNGDYSALKAVVCRARPSAGSLVWDLPLDEWAMPNDLPGQGLPTAPMTGDPTTLNDRKVGFALTVQSVGVGEVFAALGSSRLFAGFPPPPAPPIPPLAVFAPKSLGGVSLDVHLKPSSFRPAPKGVLPFSRGGRSNSLSDPLPTQKDAPDPPDNEP